MRNKKATKQNMIVMTAALIGLFILSMNEARPDYQPESNGWYACVERYDLFGSNTKRRGR